MIETSARVDATANVIPMASPNFGAAKSATPKKMQKPADYKLIAMCGEYLAYMKGSNALWEADAAGENCVDHLDAKFRRSGEALLPGIARRKAKSLTGLRAKAAVLKFIASEVPLYCPSNLDAAVMASIADDIVRFQKAAQKTNTADDALEEPGR